MHAGTPQTALTTPFSPMSDNESDSTTPAQATDRPVTDTDGDVSVTDGRDVSDSEIRPMLNDMLADAPRTCPLCRGSLKPANSEQYRLKCPDCQTKFLRGDDDLSPTPKVAMRTTPIRRLKRQKKQMDRAKAAMLQPNPDAEPLGGRE